MKSAYNTDWIIPAINEVITTLFQLKNLLYEYLTNGKYKKFCTTLKIERNGLLYSIHPSIY